jgi:hypothetical protein
MSEPGSNTQQLSHATAPVGILDNAAEVAKLYSEIVAAIRTTDDTSFKLLGFVPLVSGLATAH